MVVEDKVGKVGQPKAASLAETGAIPKKSKSQQGSQDTRFAVREAYRKAILTWELDSIQENEKIQHIMTDHLLELLDREQCAYV